MSTEQMIRERLELAFKPQHMELDNESYMHSVPANSETHFRVVLVSDSFDKQRSVARHQAVYAALAEQLAGPVHALALHTFTPDEWVARSGTASASPNCLGGSKAETTGDAQ